VIVAVQLQRKIGTGCGCAEMVVVLAVVVVLAILQVIGVAKIR